MTDLPPSPRANPLLIGHDQALERFEAARASGRMPHAWLLEGPAGVGKATAAFAFARRLFAGAGEVGREDDPASAVFRQVASGSHPDLQVLEREVNAKTKKVRTEIVVDQVRQATERMLGTAAWGGNRVLVVDPADALNLNAANALLKFLEEPPAGVVVLLTCHNPRGLLPTILSRCARLKLHPLPDERLSKLLPRLDPSLTPDEAVALAALASGSAGRAFELREAEVLPTYRLALTALSGPSPPFQRAFDVVAHLEKVQAKAGSAAAFGVLSDAVRRRALQVGGEVLKPELFEGEGERLAALAGEAGLERWLAVWDKLSTLAGRVDALNLDARQHLFLAALAVATAAPDPLDG